MSPGTTNTLQMQLALFSAPFPRFSSECTTASPGRDKTSGHRCLAATVAATAQEMLCSPCLTAEAPSRRRRTRFQMTTSPLSTPYVSVVLNDMSFQVRVIAVCLFSYQWDVTDGMPVITNRVVCEILFLPLHPDTCAPLFQERAITFCLLVLPAGCNRWNADHTGNFLST